MFLGERQVGPRMFEALDFPESYNILKYQLNYAEMIGKCLFTKDESVENNH